MQFSLALGAGCTSQNPYRGALTFIRDGQRSYVISTDVISTDASLSGMALPTDAAGSVFSPGNLNRKLEIRNFSLTSDNRQTDNWLARLLSCFYHAVFSCFSVHQLINSP